MIKHSFILGLVVLAAIAISSCKDTSSGNTTPTDKSLAAPKVGSIFTYVVYDIDSTGAKVNGSDKYGSDTVIAVGIAFQSRKNVLQAKGIILPEIYQFRNYETNGDISLYYDKENGFGDRSGWLTVPLASKGKQFFIGRDTMTNGKKDTRTSWFTYTGEENLLLSGRTFHAFSFFQESVDQDGHTEEGWGTWWFDSVTGILLKFTYENKAILELSGYNPK